MSKGDEYERQASLIIHKQGIPVMISPEFLRQRGGGQIDIAILKQFGGSWTLKLYEIKSGNLLSNNQLARIKKSSIILSSYFAWNVTFQLWGQYSRQNFKDHLI